VGRGERLRIRPTELDERGVRSRWRIGMQFAGTATKGSLDVRNGAWSAQPENSKTSGHRRGLAGMPRSSLTTLLVPPTVLDVPVNALRMTAGMGKPSGGSARLFRPRSLTDRLVQDLAKTDHHLPGRPKPPSLETDPNGAAFSRLINLFAYRNKNGLVGAFCPVFQGVTPRFGPGSVCACPRHE